MGLFNNIWNGIFKKTIKEKSYKQNHFSSFPDYNVPTEIYSSTLVFASINAIAEEVSKMIIKSVRITKGDDGRKLIKENEDAINRLFSYRPNPLQTTKDLIYWSVSKLKYNSNFYWYPEYEVTRYADKHTEMKLKAIYPINSFSETIQFDENSKTYYIIFTMDNGKEYQVPYEEVIHVRENYGPKSFFFGSRNRNELLQTVGIVREIKKLLPKAMKTSLQVRGVVTAKAQADSESLKKWIEQIESQIDSSKKGLIATDVAATYSPVNTDPKVIDKETLSYLDNQIIQEFGVSLSIINGDASESDWSSFYQKCIEPIQEAIEQAATSVLFTENEFAHGNRIKTYDRKIQRMSMDTRLKIISEMGPRGYLSREEQRELIGYEPDGGSEQIAINQYVKAEDQSVYQVGKSNKEADKE